MCAVATTACSVAVEPDQRALERPETDTAVDRADSNDERVDEMAESDAGDGSQEDAGTADGDAEAQTCVVEVCNGIDDDCDGEIDEDFLLGAACTGACDRGVVECDGEGGVLCSTDPTGSGYVATEETCNGEDDDCNGVVDDVMGLGEACSGPDTCGVGKLQCRGDALVCSTGPGGLAYSPKKEVCNGRDDDCDGETDEGVKNACGYCGPPPVDVCDGLDNDCDGETDEGVKNACGRCGPVPAETCNGIDDDCDGQVDEGVKNACGYCGPVPEELCNGIDDDCDGQVDEGVKNACGTCGPEPVEVCNGIDDDCNGQVDEGVKNACGYCGPVPQELCNGIDDDCNGQVDEGLPRQDYYPDCDGDGFGRSDAPVVRDCRPPSGCAQVLNNDDCSDQDADVHPAQQAFFSEATQGSFDYDCSGAAERELPVTRAVCQGLVCFANGYWDTEESAAPCGAFLRYCSSDNDYCEACGPGLCLRQVLCR